MKSAKHRSDHDEQLGAADELIREVAEHVVARGMPPKRNKKKRNGADTSAVEPVAAAVEAEPAPPPPVEQAPIVPPPVMVEPVVTLARVQATGRSLAMFCYDDQGSVLGQYVSQVAEQLAQRNTVAHVFTRNPYTFSQANARSYAVGDCPGPDLLASAYEFAKRARERFAATFGTASMPLLGQEWTSIPALLELAGASATPVILSLHSVEAQRSDLSSEISRKINALEVQGVAAAKTVLLHQPSTSEALNRIAPDAGKKVVLARQAFPIQQFISTVDPGEIKKRVQVGPVDPMVLYVGVLDERHGPDVLMRAAPTILKNYRQTRFVFIGDGSLIWPLRVHSRYVLLDYATRILGHMSGQGLNELIHAADMIVVPSRELTEEWPVLAGWAASKPVVATHNATKGLIEHDKDGLLVYPSENSLVWGMERLLQNQELRVELGRNGHQKLQRRYGFGSTAEQVEELLGFRAAAKA